jgi:hypothetical protein
MNSPFNFNINTSERNSNPYDFGSQPNFEGTNLNGAFSTYLQRNENPFSNPNSLTAQQLQQQLLQRQYNFANQQMIQNANINADVQNYWEESLTTHPASNMPISRQINQQDASYYSQNTGKLENEEISTSLSEIWKDDKRLFLMFIHTLFKCMKKFNFGLEEELSSRAKQIINECTEKNRAGVPNYSPLTEVISSRLKSLGGIQLYWNQAEKYVLKYHSRQISDVSNNSSEKDMIPL